jgi:hypothetical protein
MATDVARLSFDPARFYRGVVPQQGRVTLEAEQNEQRVIDSEERRKEIIDIVGPAGTPDNGYAVSLGQGPGFDLSIGHGTMYVGGWRVELDTDLDTAKQPDWIDTPLQVENPVRPTREHILLWLQDTDVTAVEDPALYEVALGGPDGAARTRLLQRVKRLPTEASSCANAAQQEHETWAKEGLSFGTGTMELLSQSRLQVTWLGASEPPNPCEPTSTGGYLGAENQCIRVQITDVHPDGTFNLLWGYDDAAFLYRVTADTSTTPGPVLTLDQTPADDYHRPRAGQAVQALRAAAQLTSTDGAIEGYVAALGGVPGVLTAPYDPDTKTVQFPQPLGSEYTNPGINPQLYLRVWEEWLQNQQLNTPISLTGTGMQITITVAGNANLHLDDFWCIGVRPATPTAVYPNRYLHTPQPPDGPHQWICPLAVISWEKETFAVLEDCRNHFKPLIDTQCADCCTIDVHPSDAANLQKLIDDAVKGRATTTADGRVIICFQPGRYELTTPLVLFGTTNVTLRACNEAAVLAVAAGAEAAFWGGMVGLIGVGNVTVTGFEFDIPQVPVAISGGQAKTGGLFTTGAVRALNATVGGNIDSSIAISVIGSTAVDIDHCSFLFTFGDPTQSVFGVAVWAAGLVSGLRLNHNQFQIDSTAPEMAQPPQFLAGLLHVNGLAPGAVLPAALDNAVITDNDFRGLTAVIFVIAQLGAVRVADNVITQCYAGVSITDVELSAGMNFGDRQVAGQLADAARQTQGTLAKVMFEPVLGRLAVLAQLFPLPQPEAGQLPGLVNIDVAQLPTLRKRAAGAKGAFMARFDERAAADQPASGPATAAAAKTTTVKFSGTEAVTVDPNLVSAAAALGELTGVVGVTQSAPTSPSSLRFENNTVDCGLPGGASTGSGPALSVLSTLQTDPALSSVAVDTNRLISRGPLNIATATVLGGAAVTINANLIVNEGAPDSGTLALLAGLVGGNQGQSIAVVGNVLSQTAVIPQKWLSFNAEG